jgi:hypothetical protein
LKRAFILATFRRVHNVHNALSPRPKVPRVWSTAKYHAMHQGDLYHRASWWSQTSKSQSIVTKVWREGEVGEAWRGVNHHEGADWPGEYGVLSGIAATALWPKPLFCRSIIKCARDAVGKRAVRHNVSCTLWRCAFACEVCAAAAMARCVCCSPHVRLH